MSSGTGRSKRVALTVGSQLGSVSGVVTFDAPMLVGLNYTFRNHTFENWSSNYTSSWANFTYITTWANWVSSGGSIVTLVGSMVSADDYSMRVRGGLTAAELTHWISDTSLKCRLADGFKGTMRTVLTHGLHVGSVTQMASFDSIAISGVAGRNMNAPVHSMHTVSFLGGNTSLNAVNYTITWASFAIRSPSDSARIGFSVCEATVWRSSTTLSCQSSLGYRTSRAVMLTAGSTAASFTDVISFDTPKVSSSSIANVARYEHRRYLSVSGNAFGSSWYSGHGRMGSTAVESSIWISDTCMHLKTVEGYHRTLRLTLTSGERSASVSESLSFDLISMHSNAFAVNSSAAFNVASSGSYSLTVYGINLGVSANSHQSRISGSAVEATNWISTTALPCRVSFGNGASAKLQVTAGVQSGTWSSSVSFSAPTFNPANTSLNYSISWAKFSPVSSANSPTTGSLLVTLSGRDYSSFASTTAARTSGTACERSSWISDSSIMSKISQGLRTSSNICVTAGMAVGSISTTVSYDHSTLAVITSESRVNQGIYGRKLWTLIGSSFGMITLSHQIHVGLSQVENTKWQSDSSVQCRASSGSMRSLALSITAGNIVGSLSGACTYDTVMLLAALPSSLSLGSNLSPEPHHNTTSNMTSNSSLACTTSCPNTTSDASPIHDASSGNSTNNTNSSLVAGVQYQETVASFFSNSTNSSLLHRETLAPFYSSFGSNHPVSGKSFVQLVANQLSLSDLTGVARSGATGCESSTWISDTSLNCKAAAGIKGSTKWILTTGGQSGTLTEALSFDTVSYFGRPGFSSTCTTSCFSVTSAASPSSFAVYNLFSTGGVDLTVFGSSFSDLGYSVMGRIGITACEMTRWISDSHLMCKYASGIKATRYVSVTLGQKPGSMSEAYSISIPSISSKLRSNSAITGSVSVTVFGSGLQCASVKGRLLHTASEATMWMSNSMILAMSASTTYSSRILAVTAGISSGSMTQAISFDDFTISTSNSTFNTTLARRNVPSTGSVLIAITSSRISSLPMTERMRAGDTACESTSWASATSVLCTIASGVMASQRLLMTVGMAAGSATQLFSTDGVLAAGYYGQTCMCQNITNVTNSSILSNVSGVPSVSNMDNNVTNSSILSNVSGVPSVSSMQNISNLTLVSNVSSKLSANASSCICVSRLMSQHNGPVTGSSTLTIFGSSMSLGHSIQSRVSGSATEASAWISTTMVRCRRSSGLGASFSILLTSGTRAGTLSQALSFDGQFALPCSVPANHPSTGSIIISLYGAFFSTIDHSTQGRLGSTSCESSAWESETSILCRQGRGRGASAHLTITTGILLSSASQTASYDVPVIHRALATNCPATGYCVVEVHGSGFGSADFSPTARIGRTGCMATPWTSQSSLQCKIPRGTGKLTTLTSTVGGIVGSVSVSFSYDVPYLIPHTLRHSNVGDHSSSIVLLSTEGKTNVTFKGKNFGPYASDIFVTYGHPPRFDAYICEVDKFSSNDSHIACQVAEGIGDGHRFTVVVDTQIGLGTDTMSYPPPVFSRPSLRVLPNAVFSSSVTGTSTATNADTIEISGSNFGPHSGDIWVSYGPRPSASKYRCSVTSSGHNFVYCLIDSGSGRNLVFNITVGRQSVISNETFSYPTPAVNSNSIMRVGGPGASRSAIGKSTQGGIDELQVTGSSLGPVAKDVSVAYGKTAPFNQHLCFTVENQAIDSQSTFRCVTSSGTGTGHKFNVTVADQSTIGQVMYDYPKPEIRSGTLRVIGQNCSSPTRCWETSNSSAGTVIVTSRSTVGGLDVIEMDGYNFGPVSEDVQVTYGRCPNPCTESSYVPEYECTVVRRGGFSLNHSRIQCVLSHGIGSAHAFAVSVGGQTAVSQDRISYPDPVIYTGTIRLLDPNASSPVPEYVSLAKESKHVVGSTTLGGHEMIELKGRNFGPLSDDISVSYGPTSNTSKYACKIVSAWEVWNHTVLRCILEEGSGTNHSFRVYTTRGGQGSMLSNDTFSYPAPRFITGSLRRVESRNSTNATSGSNALTEIPIFSKSDSFSIVNSSSIYGQDRVVVDGRNFGPHFYDLKITYSRLFSPYTYQATVLPNGTSHSRIFFETTKGMGQNLVFNVAVGGQSATGSDLYSYPMNGTVQPNSTCADASRVFSTSLTIATAGSLHTFTILARDWQYRLAGLGGDIWNVTAVDAEANKPNTTVVDNLDGTYSCYIPVTRSGLYSVGVRLLPLLLDLFATPMPLMVLPSDVVEPKYCVATEIEASTRTAGVKATFIIEVRDVFGNEIFGALDLLYAFASNASAGNVTSDIFLQSDGRYQSALLITRSANYIFSVFYNGTASNQNPYSLTVISNDALPSNSIQFGAARNISKTADETVVYRIQLADVYGNWRTRGGDRVIVAIDKGPISGFTAVGLEDNLNGSYSVLNRMTRSGEYTISLGLDSLLNPLSFSPVLVTVLPGAPYALACSAVGPALELSVAGEWSSFSIRVKDQYGNRITTSGTPVVFELFGLQSDGTYAIVQQSKISWSSKSGYVGQYYRERAGKHLIAVTIGGKNVFGSPFSLFVDASILSVKDCTAFQTRGLDLAMIDLETLAKEEGLFGTRTMDQVDVVVRAKDRFGNSVNAAGINFDFSTVPSLQITLPRALGQGHVLYSFTPGPSDDGGPYALIAHIRYSGTHISGSPFTLSVRPAIGPPQPGNCIASGEGLSFGTAGKPSSFAIQAVDYYGLYLTRGGQRFTVSMTKGVSSATLNVFDQKTGIYGVTFTATVSGFYSMQVLLSGLPIKESPFTVQVLASAISPQNSLTVGRALTVATAGMEGRFIVIARDRFSNIPVYSPTVVEGLVRVSFEGPVTRMALVTDLKNSSYLVSYHMTISGSYQSHVTMITDTVRSVGNSPFALIVHPNEISPSESFLQGSGMVSAIAGVQGTFFINANDRFFNPVSVEGHSMMFRANGTVQPLTKTLTSFNQLMLSYSLFKAGSYSMAVQIEQVRNSSKIYAQIFGSPFTLEVMPDLATAATSVLHLLQTTLIAGEPFLVNIIGYDRFENRVRVGGASVRSEILGSLMYRSPVSDHGNGTYSAIFSELAVGKYTVFAFLDGKPVEKVVPQNNATIIPGPMDSVASTAVDLSSLETVAGNPGELIVSVRDQYYNPTTYRIHNLTLMLAPQQLNIAGTEIFIAVGWRPQACPCYPPIVPGRKCECHRFRVKRTAIGLEACNLTDTTLAAVAGSKTENSSSVLSALPWCACNDCECSADGSPITPPDVYNTTGNCTGCRCNGSIPIFPPISYEPTGACASCTCDASGEPRDTRPWLVVLKSLFISDQPEGVPAINNSVNANNTHSLPSVNATVVANNFSFCTNCSCSSSGILLAREWFEYDIRRTPRNFTLKVHVNGTWNGTNGTNATYRNEIRTTYYESILPFPRIANCSACMCQAPKPPCNCGCKPRVCDCQCPLVRKCSCGCELLPPTPKNITKNTSPARSFFAEESTETLKLSWNMTRSGSYSLSILLGRSPVGESPFSVVVRPGPARPGRTQIFGEGLSVATAGSVSFFLLQTRDQFGNAIVADPSSPQLPFKIVLRKIPPQISNTSVENVSSRLNSSYVNDASLNASGSPPLLNRQTIVRQGIPIFHEIWGYISGFRNGSFVVSYLSTQSGTYSLVVDFGFVRVLENASVICHTHDMSSSASVIVLSESWVVAGTKQSEINVRARDTYGNYLTSGDGISLVVFHYEPGFNILQTEMANGGDGTFSWVGNLTQSGEHMLRILRGSSSVLPAPLRVFVHPANASNTFSYAIGSGILGGRLASTLDLSIIMRDGFQNIVAASDSDVPGITVTYASGKTTAITPDLDPLAPPPAGFKASFTVLELGSAIVVIKLRDQHIHGSPFSISLVAGTNGVFSQRDSFLREPITRQGTAGEGMTFTVQSVDKSETESAVWSRTHGGLSFFVEASALTLGKKVSFIDQEDGSYRISLTITSAGKYLMAVLLDAPQCNRSCINCIGNLTSCHISGSPFQVDVMSAFASAEHSTSSGDFLTVSTAGVLGSFRIQARDRFLNSLTFSHSPGLPFEARISGPSDVQVGVEDVLDGSFDIRYHITVSGTYSVQYRLSSGGIWVTSPLPLQVLPGVVSKVASLVSGAGLTSSIAGIQSEFRLRIADHFGNAKGKSGLRFLMMPYNGSGFSVSTADDDWLVARYIVTKQATYSLKIYVGNINLQNVPFQVSVQAGAVNPSKCTASGNGIREIVAADFASFSIASRDSFSNLLSYGGFSFTVFVTDSYSLHRGKCLDKGTGNYLCNYMTTISGSLRLAVTYGSDNIKGSPFNVRVIPNVLNATNTLIYSHSISSATAGVRGVVKLTARDRAGNYLYTGWDNFVIKLESQASSNLLIPTFNDFKNGTYVITYLATRAESYKLSVLYQNLHVDDSPYSIGVIAAPVDASVSKVYWKSSYLCQSESLMGHRCASVNPEVHYRIEAHDAFLNIQPDVHVFRIELSHNDINSTHDSGAVHGGTYAYLFAGTHAGKYQIKVSIDGNLVQNRAHQIYLEALPFSAGGFFEAFGPGLSLTTTGTQVSFGIRSRDFWGNPSATPSPSFELTGRNEYAESIEVSQMIETRTGFWRVGMWVNKSGSVELSVQGLGVFVKDSPFALRVAPGPVSPEMSTAAGPGIDAVIFQVEMFFDLMPRDVFGNVLEEILQDSLQVGIHTTTQGSPQWFSDKIEKTPPVWKARYTFTKDSTYLRFVYVSVMINGKHIGTVSMPKRGDFVGWKGSPFVIPIRRSIGDPVAGKTIARGLATSLGTAGVISSFDVQTIDDYGLHVTTGGRTISVEMIKGSFYLRFSSQNSKPDSNMVVDNQDGSYKINYLLTVAGSYKTGVILDADIIGTGPFFIEIQPGVTSAEHSVLLGDGLTAGTAGNEGSFVIEARDRFFNLQLYRPAEVPPFKVEFDGPTKWSAVIKDARDSTYVAVYNFTASGTYSVQIAVRGFSGSQTHALLLSPGAMHAGTSFIHINDIENLMAGQARAIPIRVHDRFGNMVPTPNTVSALSEVNCLMPPKGKIDVFATKNQFVVTLDTTASGAYSLTLSISGEPVPTSPYKIHVQPRDLSATESRVVGNGLFGVVAAETAHFVLYPVDSLGNPVTSLLSRDVNVFLQSNRSGFSFSVLTSTTTSLQIEYSATFPCDKCLLNVQIQGVHVKDSPFTIDVTPAEPPYLKSAVFESHLAGATVVFDQATDVGNGAFSGIFDCKRLLDSHTYLLVGQGSKCSWTSESSFSISFGQNPTVSRGSPIAVQVGLILNARRNSKPVSGSVFLRLPKAAIPPTPVVNSPGRVAACDELQIDASSSYGDGGREMVFKWGLELGPANRDLVMKILNALPAGQRVVHIPKSTLLSGTRYVFTLSVRNFVDVQKSVSIPVTVAGDDTPQLFIAGNSVQNVKSSMPISLRGRAQLSSCAASGTQGVDFSWTQTGGPQLLQWPIPKTVKTASLFLPARSLAVGQTYTFRLNGVVKNNANSFSSAEVTINVEASPIIAVIQGGNRSHSENMDLELDASGSIDPDGVDGPFSFNWQCVPNPCFEDRTGIMVKDSSKIVIPGGSFVSGTTVTFTVTVQKDPGPRVSSASVEIDVVQANLPGVSISLLGTPKRKVNADDRLAIVGNGTFSNGNRPCINLQYSWQLLTGDIDLKDESIRSTALTSPNLVLMPGILTPGQEYLLQLQAGCSQGNAGKANVVLVVNKAPVGGSFMVSPTTGVAFDTKFTLSCSKWVDDIEDLPLQYSYHIGKAENMQALQPLSGVVNFNVLKVFLTPTVNASDFLIARVCDSLGACATPPSVSVQVAQPPSSVSASSLFDNLIVSAEAVGDTETLIGAAGAISSLMNTNRRRGSSDDAVLREKILTALTTASASSVLTSDFVAFIGSSVEGSMIASSPSVMSYHFTGMSLIETLIAASIDLGSISEPAASYFSNALSGTMKAEESSRKSVRRQGEVKVSKVFTRIQTIMTSLGHARIKDTVAFESPLNVKTELFEQTVGRYAREQLLEGDVSLSANAVVDTGAIVPSYKCSRNNFCNAVVLPSSFNPIASVSDAQLMVWSIQLYNEDTALTLSDTTSLQILAGPNAVDLPKMESPAIFSLGITPTKMDAIEAGDYHMAKCEFWDTTVNSWSKKGCLAIGTDANVLRCACYHLTDFVAMMRPGLTDLGRSDAFLAENGKIIANFRHHNEILIAACCAFLLGVALAGFGYYIDHHWSRSDKHALHPIIFSSTANRRVASPYAQEKVVFRFRSLFFNLWSRRSAHLLKTEHGILGIFFRAHKDSYDRAARVTTLFVYVTAAMVVNILWLGEAGFTNDYQILPGMLTGFVLIPLQPLYSLMFRLIETPSAARRRVKRELKAQREEVEREERKKRKEEVKLLMIEREERKKQEALAEEERRRAKDLVRQGRRGRVEVAANVETVGLQENQVLADTPSETVAGAKMGSDANDLGWGALAPAQGAKGRKGPRTPEGSQRRPTHSAGTVTAAAGAFQRPAGLPPVREAFDDSIDISHAAESPLRGVRAKHGHHHVVKHELTRDFLYAGYGITLLVYGLLIFVTFLYGTTFDPDTQYAWLVATVTTIIFEFFFWEPLMLIAAAWLEVRSHLWQVMRPPIEKEQEQVSPPDSPVPEVPVTPPPPTPPPPVPKTLSWNYSKLIQHLIPMCNNEVGRKISLEDLNRIATVCDNPYDHASKLGDREEDLEDFWMTLGVHDVFESVSFDTLLDNIEIQETDKLIAKFFLRHELEDGKIVPQHIRAVMSNIMSEEHINALVKKKKAVFARVPSKESQKSGNSRASRVWERLRSGGGSGAILKSAVSLGLKRAPSAVSAVESIKEEEEEVDSNLTFEEFKQNVHSLIMQLKVQNGEIEPLDKKFKKGIRNLILEKKKEKQSLGSQLFTRVASFGSAASALLSRLRKDKEIPENALAADEVAEFQRVDSFGRIASVSTVASVVSHQRDDAAQAASTSDDQAMAYSASAAGVNRRLKAAIAKLDMARARERLRADRSLVMYDIEPSLLEVPAFSLQELHELDETSSLPGTPTQPTTTGRPGTTSRPGTTPRSQILGRPASGGEFSRPSTGGRPPSGGSMSRPSTGSSEDALAPGASARGGRESPLISKRELA